MSEESKSNNEKLLVLEDLKTYFPVRGGLFSSIRAYIRAVDGVSLAVKRGKTLGLVGESGCGKTTVGRSILRLVPITSGKVIFEGQDILTMSVRQMRALRPKMQLIFQDPVGSLNPRMTVGNIIGEALTVHGIAHGQERRDQVASLLERVGLMADHMSRYPHEFSGGQRQRIGVARALALKPRFIVCDEPVSALDVSVQSQILNLLGELQEELGLSYLFIAHNLAVVEHFSHDVAVMYLGRIVEIATVDQLYNNPRHPYTEALLSAVPLPDPSLSRQYIGLKGEVPSAVDPPSGCPFHPRCPIAIEDCAVIVPPLEQKSGQEGHLAACILRD